MTAKLFNHPATHGMHPIEHTHDEPEYVEVLRTAFPDTLIIVLSETPGFITANDTVTDKQENKDKKPFQTHTFHPNEYYDQNPIVQVRKGDIIIHTRRAAAFGSNCDRWVVDAFRPNDDQTVNAKYERFDGRRAMTLADIRRLLNPR